jgi:hypothetical protein
MDLHGLLACLEESLEELLIADCEFVMEEPAPLITFPALQRVQILESISGLTPFCFADVPLATAFHVRIRPNDLEDLEDWPHIWGLLAHQLVCLSLAGSRILRSPRDSASRLLQVASLPHVQLEGLNWS